MRKIRRKTGVERLCEQALNSVFILFNKLYIVPNRFYDKKLVKILKNHLQNLEMCVILYV